MSRAGRTAVVVIGVGNRYRGDDGAGLRAIELARRALPHGASVCETDGEPTRLLDAWDGADVAFVTDAVCSGARPGTVHRVEGTGCSIPGERAASSHALGVGEALALGRALDRLPARLVVFGIEGECFDDGEGLSPAVAAGAAVAAAAVTREVGELLIEEDPTCA